MTGRLVIRRPSHRSVGWGSSVGIATRYGLEGPGIETWWGARFSGVQQPGRGVTTHPNLVQRLKNCTSSPHLGLHSLL
jgi:hypothetical protein